MAGSIQSIGKTFSPELDLQASLALRAITKPLSGISKLENADLVAHVEAYKIQTRSERQKTSPSTFLDPLVRQRLFVAADAAKLLDTDDPDKLRTSLAAIAEALNAFAAQLAAGHLPGIGQAISIMPQLKLHVHPGKETPREKLVPFRDTQALVLEKGDGKTPIGIVISHHGLGKTPDGNPISLLVEISDQSQPAPC